MPDEIELNNIRAGVTAMLAASTSGKITAGAGIWITNLRDVETMVKGQVVSLSDYVAGLVDGAMPSGQAYMFDQDGNVTKVSS